MYLTLFFLYSHDDNHIFTVKNDAVNKTTVNNKDINIHLELDRSDDDYVKTVCEVLDNSVKQVKLDDKLSKCKLSRICLNRCRDHILPDVTLLCYVHNVKHKLSKNKTIIDIEEKVK